MTSGRSGYLDGCSGWRRHGSHSWSEHFDVLIVGAGLSGIGAGYHLQEKCPGQELRHPRGPRLHRRHLGSVSLSRHPLRQRHVHARLFVQAVDRAEGDRRRAAHPELRPRDRGRERHRQEHPLQPPRQARVVVDAGGALDRGGRAQRGRGRRPRPCASPAISCSCARAITNTRNGYTPEFPGATDFAGRIVHPQKWPDDLDYAGKRVVVIGSGATAVTLVPEMAKTAAHVTMLQRSPTYVVSRPAQDPLANKLRAQSAGEARLSSDPLAQRAVRACISSSSAGASRSGSSS